MSQGKSALSIVKKYHPGVTKIVDAKKDLEIEVTARDCKSAKCKSASSCAMARACDREFDGAVISMSVAYMVKGDKATRYRVPQSVAREIVSFDRNHDFAPGEYTLTAPASTDRLSAIKTRNRDADKRVRHDQNARKISRRHKTAGIRAL